jgi:predicted outer membrane repeat protein
MGVGGSGGGGAMKGTGGSIVGTGGVTSSSSAAGAGGRSASGGASGDGGATGNGGVVGTGGGTGSGGALGGGGVTGKGGATGFGGTTSSGGTAGNGGATGTGIDAGTGGDASIGAADADAHADVNMGAGGVDASFDGAGGAGGVGIDAPTGQCLEGWAGPGCSTCVFYVDRKFGVDTNDGRSWSKPKFTLQAGIDAAWIDGGGCNVWVAQGTYLPTSKPVASGDETTATLFLRSGIPVYGGFNGTEYLLEARDVAANVTVISGEIGSTSLVDNLTRVVTAADQTTLDGFTISAGYNASNGAGVYCTGGAITLANDTFSKNTAYLGAAIYLAGTCSATLSGNTFAGNKATQNGGAIYANAGPLTIARSTFSQNTALSGAAIYVDGSVTAALSDCTFTGNKATQYGGAIFANTGPLTIARGTFSQNTATSDGGAVNAKGPLSVTGSNFSQNTSRTEGGAIMSLGASTSIGGCTFTSNSAGGANLDAIGGAISYQATGTLNIANSQFLGNTAGGTDHASGGAVFAGGAITIQDSTFSNNQASGSYSAAAGALFVDTSANLRLARSSFAGNVCTAPSFCHGGAIYLTGGSLATDMLVNVVFDSNTAAAGFGGAIFLYLSTTIANVVFVNNQAGYGGAIASMGGTVVLGIMDSTFFGNSATISGGALYESYTTGTIANTILWGNQAPAASQVYVETSTSTIAYRYSDVQGSVPGTGNLDTDPLFVSTTAGSLDLRLQATSPCVGAGDTAALPLDVLDVDGDTDTAEALPLDLAGAPRVVNSTVDLGAYERAP